MKKNDRSVRSLELKAYVKSYLMKLMKYMLTVFKHARWRLFSMKTAMICLLVLTAFVLKSFIISTSVPLDQGSMHFRHQVRQYTPMKDKHLTVVKYRESTQRARKFSTNHHNWTTASNNSSSNDHTLHSVSKSSDMLVNDSSKVYDIKEDNKDNLNVDIFGNIVRDSGAWQRQTRCDRCFKHDFKYKIKNEDICKLHTYATDITLLILILTSHRNKLQRNAFEETWLTISKNNTGRVRYAFLLGEVPDTKLRDSIAKENDQFRDFIQEDFIDSYDNLTYKTIMGFKWAATKCAAAKFVMKTDDDMFVNVPNVLNLALNNSVLLQTNIVGKCFQMKKPNRDRKSKWFASNSSYPQNYYSGFCTGTGYLTSMHVVNRIYKISPYVPFFHLEDVYVGLCIKRLGYSVEDMPVFNSQFLWTRICIYRGHIRLATVHSVTTVALRQIWNAKCSHMQPFLRILP